MDGPLSDDDSKDLAFIGKRDTPSFKARRIDLNPVDMQQRFFSYPTGYEGHETEGTSKGSSHVHGTRVP